MIRIISAMSSNGIIGVNGGLVVKSEVDMKHFRKSTIDATIIMGRKTFESMGSKPLPKRRNVVISSNKIDNPKVETFSSLQEAISAVFVPEPMLFACDSFGMPMMPVVDVNNIWLIGGAGIYEEGMKYVDEIHLTVSDKEVTITKEDNFVRFPVINPVHFKLGHVDYISKEEDDSVRLCIFKRI